MQLSIVILDPFGFLERGYSQHILILLIHGDTIVKEGLPAASMVLLQMAFTLDCQAIPIGFPKECQTHLLKVELFFQIPLFLAIRLNILIFIVLLLFLLLIVIVLIFILRPRRYHIVLIFPIRCTLLAIVVDDHSWWIGGWIRGFAHLASENVPTLIGRAATAPVLLPDRLALLVAALRGSTRILNQVLHIELAKRLPTAVREGALGVLIGETILVFLHNLVDLLLALDA